jgi:acetyl-CoA acyltransferase
MSRVPMGSNGGSMAPAVLDRWEIVPQGISAEVIAERWGLSREELDRYSLESHLRAARATDEGRFERELVPIELTAEEEPASGGDGAGEGPAADGTPGAAGAGAATATAVAPRVFDTDEAFRRDTSLERMASLASAFVPEGKITAGNSSQIVDGAAAVLVASERAASRLGLEPRARFLSFGIAGVDPHVMLHGNPQACERALAKAGLGWDDMAVIEVNEAFASVVLQFLADTGLHERWEAGDVNPNGGGISLGHPLGATGARITATLVSELERRDARYGIACMCIGFGQAIAGVVERL